MYNPDILFSTSVMLEVVRDLPIAPTFLRSIFFPVTKQSQTLEIAMDKITGNRRVAPYVSRYRPSAIANNIRRQFKTYNPPSIKLRKQMDAYDALSRQPGELPFTYAMENMDPVKRALQMLGEELQDLGDQFTRREELTVSELLNTGTVHIEGDDVDEWIDYDMPASHKITLTGNDLFSNSNSNPVIQFNGWQNIIRVDGHHGAANIAVLGKDVRDAFLAHAKVSGNLSSVLGTLRVELGNISPKELPDSVEFLGTLNGPAKLDLYAYDEYYEDESGNEYPIMPTDTIYMGTTRATGIFSYAAIKDLKSPQSIQNEARMPVMPTNQSPKSPNTQIFAVPRFVKTYFSEDPSAQMLLMQSSPLPIMTLPNCFMSIKAV